MRCSGVIAGWMNRLPIVVSFFFFSSRRRHTRWPRDWSSDVCSSDLAAVSALRPDAACSVRLIDQLVGGYRLAGVGGVPIADRRPVIPFGRGLTHAVAETGRPLFVEEYSDDPRALEGHWAAARGLTVYYGAPIGAAGELLGVLSVNLPAGALPTLEEREMIEALAGQAAVAMRNAHLFTQSEARRRAAESLAEISRDLAQALDREVLAQRIVDGARDLLRAQGAILLRLDSDLSEFTTTAMSDRSEERRVGKE